MTTLLAETGAALDDDITSAHLRARSLNTGVLLAISARVVVPDPLGWFARAAGVTTERFYWQAPDGLTLVGAGVAREFTGDGASRFARSTARGARCSPLPCSSRLTPRRGWSAASPSTPTGPPRPLGRIARGRLVLPRLLLTRSPSGHADVDAIVEPDMDPNLFRPRAAGVSNRPAAPHWRPAPMAAAPAAEPACDALTPQTGRPPLPPDRRNPGRR